MITKQKAFINKIQPLINQIVDEEVSGQEIYSTSQSIVTHSFCQKRRNKNTKLTLTPRST